MPTANELLSEAADLIEGAAEKRGYSDALFDLASTVRSYQTISRKKGKKKKVKKRAKA